MDLIIDFETYSETDLKACGATRYISDLSFKPLCMAYKEFNPDTLEWGETKIWTFQNPESLDLSGYNFYWAFNAAFDLKVYKNSKHNIKLESDLTRWKDIQVLMSKFSLPQNLEQAAEVLKVPIKKKS